MDGPDRVSPEAYIRPMRERVEAALRRVAEAVNAAPDGAWINGSEMQVLEEFNGLLRRDAYERALQMRADGAASGFSPGGPGDGPAEGGQGAGAAEHADGLRPGERRPRPVARARVRGRRAGGPAAG
jgi:hypothetical protein